MCVRALVMNKTIRGCGELTWRDVVITLAVGLAYAALFFWSKTV